MSKNFAVQPVILVLALDPVRFVGGYLLGPSLGVDPLVDSALGLVAASIPMSSLVVQQSV